MVHRSELNRFAMRETDRIACTSFTRGEGAREANGGSQPAGWRTADGRMWFPSIEEVTVADPTELPLDEAPPSALIESLEIGENRELNVRFTALGFSSPERERAERSLSKTQVELRRLSQELLTSQDTVRRRLSRELHDDLSQRLAALAIQAQVVRRRLGDGNAQTCEQVDDIVEMSRQLAIDVQQLSRRLHPIGLRSLGLAEAVRQECDAFARRGGVDVEVEENIASDEVSEEVSVAAFRILQESLHNVEKHARASAVKVRVVVEHGELVVSIADRGQGFDTENGSDAGLGLITMRERAASIAGELSVTSSPGGGTTVCLRVP